jgi:cyclophilin family peptidyl-prolyl cis-trans isomerase
MLCLVFAVSLWAWQSPSASAQIPGCWTTAPTMDNGYPNWATPPQMVIDPARTYTAEVETSHGTITIELDAKAAPTTVNNFVCLASAGYYDFTLFHRIINGFMIQAGDPTGTGMGGPGYQINDELPTGQLPYKKGSVAMANAGPNTNGSQFFIVQADQPAEFPANYSIFGHVTSGIEVVDEIAAVAVQPSQSGNQENSDPIRSVGIESIQILQDGQPMTAPAATPSASPGASPVAAVQPTTAPTTAAQPTATPVAAATTEDDDDGGNTPLWIALGVAGLAAVGYGAYRMLGNNTKGKKYTVTRNRPGAKGSTAAKAPAASTRQQGTGSTARPTAQRRSTQSTRPSRRKRPNK